MIAELLSFDHVIIIAVIAAAVGWALLNNKRPRIVGLALSREEYLTEKVEKLQAAQESLLRSNAQAQDDIARLKLELVEAKKRIAVLEAQVAWYEKEKAEDDAKLASATPPPKKNTLLVILGDDKDLYVDLVALRKVAAVKGFRLSRVYPATYDRIKDAIDRRRRDGNPVKYVHIAAHACENGVQLLDQRTGRTTLVSPSDLSDILGDVEVLVINGCESSVIGDNVGIPFVVTMREEVPHNDAKQFAEVFWSAIGNKLSPEEAYDQALDRVPNDVSEYAEFHS